MMIKCMLGLLAATVLPAYAQELKKVDITAESWALGEPPAEVFVVDGKVEVAEKDGNKALVIHPGTELVDSCAQLATSASGSATIQTRTFASKRGRSVPRFGISAHGLSGYRLYITPAKRQLELLKGDETVASVPFTWTSESWTLLKLEVKKNGDDWSITGSAWPATEAQPADPMLKHEDKGLKGQGKCAVWATPYSGTPIFFDDIAIEIEVAAAAK